ncbi:hypothetical protein M1C57_08655 [Rhodococcus pyridinivorans]|uniref:hypothetical protein n=1 Tax=Rhodococcus pyridinivorans TaxID=103816 RepID=UPI00200A1183|nr:hypothetical protein [Rhodococcus pyridinivorans]UPW06068.1 hypothetical protein M1C57_08655 [Rhodococcus pyridinivorans]
MERGSDKHGPKKDDALAEETGGMIRANRPTRADEARDPEPPADDDPDVRPWHTEGPGGGASEGGASEGGGPEGGGSAGSA